MIKKTVGYGAAAFLVFVAALFLAPRPELAAGLIAVAVGGWFLNRLDWSQRFYVLTLILMMGATSNIGPLVAVSNYGRYAAAAALLGVTWFTTRKTASVIRSRLHKRTLGMLWFTVALAAASIVWSVDRMQTVLQVVALAVLVGLIHLLSTRRWVDRALMVRDFAVMFNVMTVAFIACLAAWALRLPGAVAYGGTADTVGRFQGFFNNPNMLAVLLAVSIPIGIGLIRERRSIPAVAGLLAAGAVLLLTESRTAIVATAIAIVWLILRSGALAVAKFAYASLIAVVVVLATGLDLFGTSLSRFGTLEGGDVLNTRGEAWTAAINLIQQQPLGYGWQAGRQLFESMHGTAGFTFTRTSVHNSYLQFILELGVIGILPIAYLSMALILITVRGKMRGLEAGLVGAATAGFIVQITESVIFGSGQAYPYVFWFAVAGALTVYLPTVKKERAKTNGLPSHYQRLARRRERASADA